MFEYENTDYWIVDPFTGEHFKPRKYGNRISDERNDRNGTVDVTNTEE